MTTPSRITRSFIRMKSAARWTGSISPSDARPVGATAPAGALEQLGGPLRVELPPRVGRPEARRGDEEVGRRLSLAPVDLGPDGLAVHQEREGLPDFGAGQEGVARFCAGALAVDLAPRVGEVELDELRAAAGGE